MTGIIVGHATITGDDVQTGVTIVCPHAGDPLVDKAPAANVVFNGFGKSIGLVQMDGLGVLGTLITPTNTFAVGAMAQAQIRQVVVANSRVGHVWLTVNPLVFECNDGYLSDLQAFAVQEVHYDAACAAAARALEQGAVGTGRGMSSFGVKGGIGSISRVITLTDGAQRTVGALVLPNFGVTKNLTLGGRDVGAELVSALTAATPEPGKGSIIIPITTDAPLDVHQLRHLTLRADAGLTHTGSVFGHGSGDTTLALPIAYTVPHEDTRAISAVSIIHESHFDSLSQVAADSAEQAIVHMLSHATVVTSRDGNTRRVLIKLL